MNKLMTCTKGVARSSRCMHQVERCGGLDNGTWRDYRGCRHQHSAPKPPFGRPV